MKIQKNITNSINLILILIHTYVCICVLQDGSVNEREIQNLDDAASANQIRMNSDPFELMLMNMGYRFPVPQHEFSDEDSEDQHEQPITPALNCRPS